MATAAFRENKENTATGGQRTLDSNVLPAVKRSRMSYTREYYIATAYRPCIYLARGAALHMAVSMEKVNDAISFERSRFRKIHELKTKYRADFVDTTLVQQRSTLEQLEW